MPNLVNFTTPCNLSGFTLIIPSVSVGNVPQLTVDLLITSLEFNKIATIWHPAIVSSVGGDPYKSDSSEMCIACELYVKTELKLAVLQLRSTIDFKLATKFFVDLKEEIVKLGFASTIIIASSFDYELHNINGQKFYYISSENIEELMKKINVKPMEKKLNGTYVCHASGFAIKLFAVLNDAMKSTVIVKYVSEGDNRPDALMCLEILGGFIDVIKMDNVKVKYPSSWDYVFGGPPPLGIY